MEFYHIVLDYTIYIYEEEKGVGHPSMVQCPVVINIHVLDTEGHIKR